jgi:putative membrane protein
MKNAVLLIGASLLLFGQPTLTGCRDGNGKGQTTADSALNNSDSKKEAEAQNKEKFVSAGNEKDARFVVDAVASNLNEIKLAQEGGKSGNAAVKKLAQQLETEHGKLVSELDSFANTHHITLPTAAAKEADEDVKKLQNKTATAFDREWVQLMIDKHEKTIDKYKQASGNVTNADLKNWIDRTLPKVQMHLDMLTQLDKQTR